MLARVVHVVLWSHFSEAECRNRAGVGTDAIHMQGYVCLKSMISRA